MNTSEKLPVIETVYMALAHVLWRWCRLSVALLPMFSILIIDEFLYLYLYESGHQQIATTVSWVLFPALIVFIITIHRIMILGPDGTEKYGVLQWKRREWKYIIISTVFILGGWIAVAGWWKMVYALNEDGELGFSALSAWIPYITVALLFSRVCLILPATAVDSHISIRESWRLTRGNTLRVSVVIYFIPLVSLLTKTIWINVTSPDSEGGSTLILDTLEILWGILLYIMEVSCLSFSYKHFINRQRTAGSPGQYI